MRRFRDYSNKTRGLFGVFVAILSAIFPLNLIATFEFLAYFGIVTFDMRSLIECLFFLFGITFCWGCAIALSATINATSPDDGAGEQDDVEKFD
jgi:hypothetical protein